MTPSQFALQILSERTRRAVSPSSAASALASSSSSADRSAALALVARVEPAQCIRRLICNLATGTMGHEDDEIVMALRVRYTD